MMKDDQGQRPTPAEEGSEVAAGIVRAFEEDAAAAQESPEPPAASPAESARLMDEAFERVERAHGLNVVPFERPAQRR